MAKESQGKFRKPHSLGKTHPIHAVTMSNLQLFFGFLETGMFVVIGGCFKVDINVIGRQRGWGN